MKKIYFDNSSTSFPKAPNVGEAISEIIEKGAFNVGRGGYEEAYNLSSLIIDTREQLSRLFNAPAKSQVCFNGGITYSINQFLQGILEPGDHIIVSPLEHNAVMRPLKILSDKGVIVDVVEGNIQGRVDLDDVEKLITPKTKAILFTHVSNVCGTIMPIEEIGKICKEHDLYFAVDSAQSAGLLPIDMQEMNIDFLAFTGHKGLRGPQGVGGFIITEELAAILKPLVTGGTGSLSNEEVQPDFLPDKFESGTLPIPAIIGLRAALLYLEKIGVEEIYQKEMKIAEHFISEIKKLPNARIAGVDGFDPQKRTAVVAVDFMDEDNAQIAFLLEQEAGVMTRVGLHCAPRAHKTIGTYPQGVVRFSFGPENTTEEVDKCMETLKQILAS